MKTHDEYNGVLLMDDHHSVGHLCIAGADSVATLIGTSSWVPPESVAADIHGVLSDGKKASLLNCVLHSQTQHRFDEYTQFESRLFPNYVVVGAEFIRSDEAVIRAVRYHFENVAGLLSGYKTFQSLEPDPGDVRRLLEQAHEKLEKIADELGWPIDLFEPEIGDRPCLLYFSGVREIIAFDTRVGRISLTNRTSQGMGTAAGIGITNEVTANIDFVEPTTLGSAIRTLHTLHGLFELSLGQRQRYRWIELELANHVKDATDLRQTARLYWSLCNERVADNSKASRWDILLAPDRRPDEFAKVAAGWMDSNAIMGDPRKRFATAFFGRYGINRIVGAANMFDLLPESHAPRKKEPDASLKAAVEQCRKAFAVLDDSSAKQSVLSALGRVGTASLRDKVYHRTDKVLAEVGGMFPDLKLPCNHAVLARNHYVHGSQASFDYQEHFTEFAFITDTLEFVFAASDLLDLGWDLKSWIGEGTTMTHPFAAYVINFPENMRRLRALVDR